MGGVQLPQKRFAFRGIFVCSLVSYDPLFLGGFREPPAFGGDYELLVLRSLNKLFALLIRRFTRAKHSQRVVSENLLRVQRGVYTLEERGLRFFVCVRALRVRLGLLRKRRRAGRGKRLNLRSGCGARRGNLRRFYRRSLLLGFRQRFHQRFARRERRVLHLRDDGLGHEVRHFVRVHSSNAVRLLQGGEVRNQLLGHDLRGRNDELWCNGHACDAVRALNRLGEFERFCFDTLFNYRPDCIFGGDGRVVSADRCRCFDILRGKLGTVVFFIIQRGRTKRVDHLPAVDGEGFL